MIYWNCNWAFETFFFLYWLLYRIGRFFFFCKIDRPSNFFCLRDTQLEENYDFEMIKNRLIFQGANRFIEMHSVQWRIVHLKLIFVPRHHLFIHRDGRERENFCSSMSGETHKMHFKGMYVMKNELCRFWDERKTWKLHMFDNAEEWNLKTECHWNVSWVVKFPVHQCTFVCDSFHSSYVHMRVKISQVVFIAAFLPRSLCFSLSYLLSHGAHISLWQHPIIAFRVISSYASQFPWR